MPRSATRWRCRGRRAHVSELSRPSCAGPGVAAATAGPARPCTTKGARSRAHRVRRPCCRCGRRAPSGATRRRRRPRRLGIGVHQAVGERQLRHRRRRALVAVPDRTGSRRRADERRHRGDVRRILGNRRTRCPEAAQGGESAAKPTATTSSAGSVRLRAGSDLEEEARLAPAVSYICPKRNTRVVVSGSDHAGRQHRPPRAASSLGRGRRPKRAGFREGTARPAPNSYGEALPVVRRARAQILSRRWQPSPSSSTRPSRVHASVAHAQV
jgi:hypothetical protein